MQRPTKRKKERPLSKKEAGFIKDYMRTGNGTLAAKRNYNVKNDRVATAIGVENLSKPRIKRYVKSFADGIPDTLLKKKHLELLTVPRKLRVMHKGEVVEEIEEVDSNALKSGLDMAYKLKGYYKNDPEAPERGVDKTLSSINTLVTMLRDERAKKP